MPCSLGCSNQGDDLVTADIASPSATRTEGDEGVVGRAAAEDFGARATNRRGIWGRVVVVGREE